MIGVLLLFYAVLAAGTIRLRFRRGIVLYVILLLNLLLVRVLIQVTVDYVTILLTLASTYPSTVMVTFNGLRRLVSTSAATVCVMITS